MTLSRRLSLVLLMVAGNIFSLQSAAQEQAAAASAQMSSSKPVPPSDDSGWHLSLSPYFWLAGTRGTVGALGRDVSVHASAGDLLSHFNFGLMGGAQARHNRLVLDGDMMWIRLSGSGAIPSPLLGATSADVRVGEFVWTSKFGYRVINHKNIKGDANVGVRYWHLGQALSFTPSTLGINFNGSQSWADILVGGHVQLPVGERVVVDLLGDVGGWNATAKLDYQFAAVLGYKLSPKWTLHAGYRYLFVDYRNGPGGLYNMTTAGALIGATWTIK